MKQRYTRIALLFFLMLWGGACRSEEGHENDYRKTYQTKTASVTVSAEKIRVNPAQRPVITVSFHHEGGKIPSVQWSDRLPLPLIEQFEKPGEFIFRFDSALPGTYLLPSLTITFDGETPLITDEITLTVYSETEDGSVPQEILPLMPNRTDWFFVVLAVLAVVFLILLAVLGWLLWRYRKLHRRLHETVSREGVGILSALYEKVSICFDDVQPDKAAVLILQVVAAPFQNKEASSVLIRFFSPETVSRLKDAVEKYRRVAFAGMTIGKNELLEDLNFLINFQKEFENCRTSGGGGQ